MHCQLILAEGSTELSRDHLVGHGLHGNFTGLVFGLRESALFAGRLGTDLMKTLQRVYYCPYEALPELNCSAHS